MKAKTNPTSWTGVRLPDPSERVWQVVGTGRDESGAHYIVVRVQDTQKGVLKENGGYSNCDRITQVPADQMRDSINSGSLIVEF